MSAGTTLNWWMKFAQADTERMYTKTKLQLLTELEDHLNPLPAGLCQWDATTVTLDDIKKFQSGALRVVEALQDTSLPRPTGQGVFIERMEGLTACRHIATGSNQAETATALMLEALRDAEIESSERLGNCKVCGKLFLQSSPKRKKLFCSTQCRNKHSREKKNGSNTKEAG